MENNQNTPNQTQPIQPNDFYKNYEEHLVVRDKSFMATWEEDPDNSEDSDSDD